MHATCSSPLSWPGLDSIPEKRACKVRDFHFCLNVPQQLCMPIHPVYKTVTYTYRLNNSAFFFPFVWNFDILLLQKHAVPLPFIFLLSPSYGLTILFKHDSFLRQPI